MKAALRPITIRDVARHANVSVASVSRALNGGDSVTETTRQRIIGVAEALNYVPHTGARSLSTRRTDTIGIVLPELHGEFFSEIIRGADQAARERGLHLLVSSSHGDPAEASAAIRSMRGRVDGLMILSPHVDRAVLAGSLADQQPTVLINTPVEDRRYPSIRVDNRAAPRRSSALVGSAVGASHIADRTATSKASPAVAATSTPSAAGLEPWIVRATSRAKRGARRARVGRRPAAGRGVRGQRHDGRLLHPGDAGAGCAARRRGVAASTTSRSPPGHADADHGARRITDLGRRALERLVEAIDDMTGRTLRDHPARAGGAGSSRVQQAAAS